jgi:mannitol 2-dehydrogenase
VRGVGLLPDDRRLHEALADQDHLYTVLVRHPDGAVDARIVGALVDHLFAPEDPERVLQAMSDPAVRVVTLTITEAGYPRDPTTGEPDLDDPLVAPDARGGPGANVAPSSAFGYLAEALRRRWAAGVAPFTVLSCDNVHANGEVARQLLVAVAAARDAALGRRIAEEVAFPSAMVDRITPRTTAGDVELAARVTGLRDAVPVTCEPYLQWVVEDRFPAGRPRLERVGVQLVDDVRPYELAKMRCVNAGHQVLAYAGRLLAYETPQAALADRLVRGLLERYLAKEAAPTLPELPDLDAAAYTATVIERFANPYVPDTIERLCAQSSTTLSTFVLPVLRDRLAAGGDAFAATAVVACWARFLEGIDEAGRSITIVDDRRADLIRRAARHDEDLLALVRDNPLFGDLEQDPRFTHSYASALATVRTRGVHGLLHDLLGR